MDRLKEGISEGGPKFVIEKDEKRSSYSAVSCILYVKEPYNRIIVACWDKQVRVYDEELKYLNHIKVLGWANNVIRLSNNVFLVGGFEKKIVSFTLLESEPYLKELKRIRTSTEEHKHCFLRFTDDLFLATSRNQLLMYSYSTENIIRSFKHNISIDYTMIPILSKKYDSCFYSGTSIQYIQMYDYNNKKDKPRRTFKPFDKSGRMLSVISFINRQGDEILVSGGGQNVYFFNTSIGGMGQNEDDKNNTKSCFKRIKLSGNSNIWCVRSLDTRSPNYLFVGDVGGYIHLISLRPNVDESKQYTKILTYQVTQSSQYVRDIEFLSYTPNSIKMVCGLGNNRIIMYNILDIEVEISCDKNEMIMKDLMERISYLEDERVESPMFFNEEDKKLGGFKVVLLNQKLDIFSRIILLL